MARKRNPRDESPTCSCLLLCDDVTISTAHQKHSLHGLIGTIVVQELPAMIGGFVAYARGSNVYGAQKIRLVFEDANQEGEIFAIEGEFSSHMSPLGVYTLIVPIPSFPVEKAGRYIFSAQHNGAPIAQTPIEVRVARRSRE